MNAYTNKIGFFRQSFNYASDYDFQSQMPDVVDSSEINFYRSHFFMKEYKPDYIVVPARQLIDEIKKNIFRSLNKKARPVYIKSYFRACQDQQKNCKIFESPITGQKLYLTCVFRNKMIKIYKSK